MSKSKAIIRDAVKFTVSGYVSSICNFVSATVVRKILDPVFMGLYTELTLIFEYAKYSNLGIFDSLDRQIPYYNGKKDFKKLDETKNIGITFSLFTSLICALGLIIFSYIIGGRLSPVLATGLKIVSVMVVIQSISTFYVTTIRASHLFGPLSNYVVIISVFDIIFKAVLGLRFGVTGMLWATVFTLILGIIYLFKKTGIGFSIVLKIPAASLRALLKIGFPLLLAGFAFMVLRSVDRLMIIAFLTKEDLGFYSIAIMAHSFIFQLPNLIYTVLFPRFYEEFGKSEDTARLKGFLEKPTIAFSCIFPILIGITIIVFPIFINYILPKYQQGITSTYILLFGTFFISITNMSGYLMVALKKQNVLVMISALCVGICILLNFIFVKAMHLGISGIALGTSITYFLYSLFIISYALKLYVSDIFARLRFLMEIYAPIVWVLFIYNYLRFFFHYNFKNLNSDIFNASIQIMVFLVLTIPLLIHVNKKTNLYSRMKNAEIGLFKK